MHLICRHFDELIAVGVPINHAIRLLELRTDVYANLSTGGRPGVYNTRLIKLWSLSARKYKSKKPLGKYVRVEHGTPRRALARMVLDLYRKHKLSKPELDKLVKKYWKLAVITLEEDRKLNKITRSTMYTKPELRWGAAGIRF